jgi:hypothetical protein
MRVETCQIGCALRLGENIRIAIHRRQGERVVLGATAPAGTRLTLDGAPVTPIAGTVGVWTYLFSLQALRRFTLGPFEVQVWLPGELVPLAADCDNWLHIGITQRRAGDAAQPVASNPALLPAPVATALPMSRMDGDGRRQLSSGP